MKNRILTVVCLIFGLMKGYAQSNLLNIEGTTGKFYLTHMVVARENWYSIGRLFNLPPHEIATYNNLSFDKPLEVNQLLYIPLTTANFDQKQLKLTDESLVPIYHVVGEKEWMFKISSIYNDIPVTSLEKWNKIKRDDVKKGTPLIVGFLKVKTDLSPLAMGVASNPAVNAPAADLPVTASANKTTQSSATTASKPVVTTAYTTSVPAAAVTGTAAASNAERVNTYASTHNNGGFFSTDFTGGAKSGSGTAGTFKSTSGWSDGKYYALMNGIPVGTIIRVSGSNGKTIYAKVLGQLPDMKESAGLIIRISNAASAEMGLGDGKFPVDIKY